MAPVTNLSSAILLPSVVAASSWYFNRVAEAVCGAVTEEVTLQANTCDDDPDILLDLLLVLKLLQPDHRHFSFPRLTTLAAPRYPASDEIRPQCSMLVYVRLAVDRPRELPVARRGPELV